MAILVMALISQIHALPLRPMQDIPIEVLNTWEITYASDIQDITCLGYGWIAFRSNADGRIYLADADCSYQDEIPLPDGAAGGFGLAYYNWSSEYYVSSGADSLIYHSDGSGSWDSIPNPAGTNGAGLDFDVYGSNELCEAGAFSPYRFYCIDDDECYDLPGINGEIGGFMVHQIYTVSYPPYALVATTRYGHEFFFFHEGYPDGYELYAQEDCPLTVEESLGLVWFMGDTVYWSYKGTDGKYYISELEIPIFGSVEDGTAFDPDGVTMTLSSNPFSGMLSIEVAGSLESPELGVYDIAGRPIRSLGDGQGASTFLWDGTDAAGNEVPPGTYLIQGVSAGRLASVRVVKL